MTPETKQILKENLQIIILFVAVFAVPFLTSFLLDLPIVKKYLVRQLIVYILMIVEFILLSKLLISEIKK